MMATDFSYRRYATKRLVWRWMQGLYILLLVVFLLTPIIVVALASVTKTTYLAVPPQGVTLHWFREVLTSSSYQQAIGTSLLLALAATAGATALGTVAAYGLHRYRPRAANGLVTLMNLPQIVPGVVLGVALLQFLTVAGLRGGMLPLIATHIIIALPYAMRSVSASLASADPLVEEAARTLGASPLKSFVLVTLPLISPGVVTGAIFSFIISIGEVSATIFILTVRQSTLPVKIFNMVEFGVNPSIAAVSTLMIIMTAVLLTVAEKYFGLHRYV